MHGDELRHGLQELLDHWEELAVPHGGRYSEQPAIADEEGVKSVPPAAPAAKYQLLAGLGLAALIGAAIFRRPRDS
jgi:hypothetical protein